MKGAIMRKASARQSDAWKERVRLEQAERMATVDWIEQQALKSIQARFATADVIAKEAQTTLTVLLAGVGGTAAYAAKLFEPGPADPLVVAAAATCGYLAFLSAVLVLACMMFRSYPAQFQEPTNLLIPDATLLQLRDAELLNLDARIKEATLLNATRARSLNSIRLGAVFAIVVFVAVGAVSPKRMNPPKAPLAIMCSPDDAASAPEGSLRCQVGT
jgi:hypothetical protein